GAGRRDAGPSGPHQQADRRDRPGRCAVPAIGGGAGAARQPGGLVHQGRRRSGDDRRSVGVTEPVGIDLPNVELARLDPIEVEALAAPGDPAHPPRILLLYGSLRVRSCSRLLAEEAGRLLRWYGCEVRFFDPRDLPLPDGAEPSHPKVAELRELAHWSEGMVWVSPERHGAMTGIMKAQIDWIPLAQGARRPTQGKTLAVMQVSGGSQSFNAVNQLRVLGRWMRMLTIPNQSSVAKAFQ